MKNQSLIYGLDKRLSSLKKKRFNMITKKELLERIIILEAMLMDTDDAIAKLERKYNKVAKELKNETME